MSRIILRRILDEYKAKSGNDKGIPRGIGVSAYLAELYMRGLDRAIQALNDVTYYARYVDDIIIIFTPAPNNQGNDYKKDIKQIIETDFNLTMNEDKTILFDLRNKKQKPYELDYLGYKIFFGVGETKTKLTERKVDKYKKRMDLAFDAYSNLSKVNEKKARKLLIRRVRFLTGNTRLKGNKKNILVGIYYSNSQLTEHADLTSLDRYLRKKINTQIASPQLKKRLQKYRFKDGFETRRFSPFKTRELSEIKEVWEKGF